MKVLWKRFFTRRLRLILLAGCLGGFMAVFFPRPGSSPTQVSQGRFLVPGQAMADMPDPANPSRPEIDLAAHPSSRIALFALG